MGRTVSEDDNALSADEAFGTDIRVPMTAITLPDELAEWAYQNRELVSRVQTALSDSYATLTDEQVWETIAATCSPEWQSARTDLRAVQEEWDDLNSPEKASLGPIGMALDSDETNSVQERFSFSLAHFTVINEGLRQRQDLGNLLSVLLVQKRMLDSSAERTHQLQASTAYLANMTSIKGDFTAASQDNAKGTPAPEKRLAPKDAGLAGTFRAFAEKVLGKEQPAPARKGKLTPASPET